MAGLLADRDPSAGLSHRPALARHDRHARIATSVTVRDNLRTPTPGDVYVWKFESEGRELNVRVDGQFVFNTNLLILQAGLAGLGLIYLTAGQIEPHLRGGELVRALDDWCPRFPGYHLYYPSRRQPTAAFALLVDRLRYRG